MQASAIYEALLESRDIMISLDQFAYVSYF